MANFRTAGRVIALAGRVLAASGHAEWSAGLESFLLRYFEWAGGLQD